MSRVRDHGMRPGVLDDEVVVDRLPDGEPQGDLLAGPDRELRWLERQRLRRRYLA
jgi:hypothetical protein